MNKEVLSARERFMLAVNHQEADRVPISPKMSSEFIAQQIGKTYWDIGWKDYYETAIAYNYDCSVYWCLQGNPAGNEGLLLRSRPDRVVRRKIGKYTSETRVWETPHGELSERLEFPNDPKMREENPDEYGLIKEFLIKEEKDIEALPYCFRDPTDIDVKECEEIRRTVGENSVIEALGPDALVNAVVSRGLEQMMFDVFERPAWMHEILRIFQKAVLQRTEVMLDCLEEADIIFTSGCYTTESIWSPRHWEKWFAPLVAEQTKLIREGGKVHHYFVDGKMMGHLRKVKEMGIGILSSLEPPDTADGDLHIAKQMIGDVVCLWGNVDPIYVLQMGNEAKIEAAVAEAISAAAIGGGFILGTGEVVTRYTPPANLLTFVDAGKRFGQYHGGTGG